MCGTQDPVEELNKQLFQQLYKSSKDLYITRLSGQISTLNSQLSSLKQAKSENTSQYIKEKNTIDEKYADKGMYNSGAHKSAVKNLEDSYKVSNASYTKQINTIEAEIATLQAEQRNPNYENVLTLLAENNDMTYYEALQKYNKYISK